MGHRLGGRARRWRRCVERPPATRRLRRQPAARGSGNGTLLTVKGLAKHFGGLKAVDGVDMEVRRGEIQALIGPNGSGKTTILNMLSGLYVPTAGEIVLGGNADHRAGSPTSSRRTAWPGPSRTSASSAS